MPPSVYCTAHLHHELYRIAACSSSDFRIVLGFLHACLVSPGSSGVILLMTEALHIVQSPGPCNVGHSPW